MNYVDPDGHVLVSAAIDTLREIAGDAGDKVQFTEWGTIDVSGFTEADLANNEGALLLHQLATSDNVYVYHEGTQINTRAGWRDLKEGFSVENLDVNYDWRVRNKGDASVPPSGVASFVAVIPTVRRVDSASDRLSVSLAAVAFHELAESYGKIKRGMQYNFNNIFSESQDGPGGAHDYAAARESALIRQRPGLTEYPAGGSIKTVWQ